MSMLAHIERQQDRIEQIVAELAELKRDKARLDWLDGGNIVLNIDPEKSEKVRLDVITDGWCKTHEAVMLRQAVDKAMTESK